MKKLLLISLLCLSGVTMADAHGYRAWHGGYRGGYYGCGGCWIAPAVVGGVIGYELSRPNYYVEPAPVIVQQPPVIVEQSNVVQQPPVGYHWQEMIDPITNIKKIVLVPN